MRCAVALIALLLLAGCGSKPPDRRADVDALAQQIRAMAGVAALSDQVTDRPAQGLVYFRVDVEVRDSITAEQLAAITAHYLHNLRAVDYRGYQAEFDVRASRNVFTIDSGALAITNGAQITGQARDWVALRQAFPAATIAFHATIAHPGGQLPVQEWGHSNMATLQFGNPADYRAVAGATATLAARFPQLTSLDWTISAGNDHPADVKTSRRLPTPPEIAVWNRLNADQSVPHIDKLRIDRSYTPSVWFSEKTTRSIDLNMSLQLARAHLPIVATLPAPVLYTASDQISGHIGFYGHARGPVALTVGGCTPRDLWMYRPTPPEQQLINSYEKCRR